MKNLIADALDAVDEYILLAQQFTRARQQVLDRLEVCCVGVHGLDSTVAGVASWWRNEQSESANAAIGGEEALMRAFEESAMRVMSVNDAIDTRLAWIDKLAEAHVAEKQKWLKDLKVCPFSLISRLSHFLSFSHLRQGNATKRRQGKECWPPCYDE